MNPRSRRRERAGTESAWRAGTEFGSVYPGRAQAGPVWRSSRPAQASSEAAPGGTPSEACRQPANERAVESRHMPLMPHMHCGNATPQGSRVVFTRPFSGKGGAPSARPDSLPASSAAGRGRGGSPRAGLARRGRGWRGARGRAEGYKGQRGREPHIRCRRGATIPAVAATTIWDPARGTRLPDRRQRVCRGGSPPLGRGPALSEGERRCGCHTDGIEG